MNGLFLSSGAWVLDIIFFALLLLGTLFGVWRGLWRSLCKLAGTIFSLVVAFTCCVPFKNSTGGLFGLENALRGAISKVPVVGTWITVAISFVVLVVLVKLGALLISFLGKGLVDKSKTLKAVDRALGGIWGMLSAALLIFFLLSVCNWIPASNLHSYIESSAVVGHVFHWVQSASRFIFKG